MDELECRRRLFADPYDSDPMILAAQRNSQSIQTLSAELQQLDTLIDQTLRIDVPDDLADRILSKQTNFTQQKEKTKPKYHYAIAASITLVFAIALGGANWQSITTKTKVAAISPVAPTPITAATNLSNPQSASLAQIALKHYYESDHVHNIDENASINQVNVKLSTLGAVIDGNLPGRITYLNYCGFEKKRAVHLILEPKVGKPINIFFVPQPSNKIEEYSDGNMQVISLPAINESSIVVVGDEKSALLPFAEKFKQQLNQSI